MTKYLLWWAIAWVVIGGIVYFFFAKETPDVLYGVALAAVISLLFLIKMLSEKYEGEINQYTVARPQCMKGLCITTPGF